jgi:penicillin amidase
MPAVLKSLKGFDTLGSVESAAMNILSKWNYEMGAQSAAASIFETMYLELKHCIFGDELKDLLYDNFNGTGSISRTALDQLFDLRTSVWFDNVNTEEKMETFDDMVFCSFSASVAQLDSKLGGTPESWEWGKLHRLTLTHPFSAKKILDGPFKLSRGPFAVGGSFHTIAPFSYSSNAPFDCNHGASHRHIYDLSNWDNSVTVIPTGNSGIPSSRHYCDQTSLYINGNYHMDHFSKVNVKANVLYHMMFR